MKYVDENEEILEWVLLISISVLNVWRVCAC